jgi:hypothetical protein
LGKKEVAEEFKRELTLRLQSNYPKDDSAVTAETCWTAIRDSLRETAQEVLGYKDSRITPWITETTLQLAEERRKAKEDNDCTWSLDSMLKLKRITNDMRASARRDKQVW